MAWRLENYLGNAVEIPLSHFMQIETATHSAMCSGPSMAPPLGQNKNLGA